jgi:hypothetical protein
MKVFLENMITEVPDELTEGCGCFFTIIILSIIIALFIIS